MGALLHEMLTRVQTFVIYPETGYTLRSTTKEIMAASRLNRVVGDCKTYSNLFVALARRLGLPARMVGGFVLAPIGAQGHVWAEIKLGDRWVPIEPQHRAGRVKPTYIPTSVFNEDTNDERVIEDPLVRVRDRN